MDLRDEACGIGRGPAEVKVDLINKLTGVNKVKKMAMIDGWGYKFANVNQSMKGAKTHRPIAVLPYQ